MSLTPMEAFLLGVRWREDIHTHEKRASATRILEAFKEFDAHPGVFQDQADGVVGSIIPLADGTVVAT
jgi:hypothetical protein